MTDQLAVGEFGADDPDASGDPDAAPDGDAGSEPARPPRISKWDRPPDPHDWRFFVGNLGKVLIATGILMFGFVAYQLWGTGIETARAQNQLEGQFEALLAEFADESDIADVDATAATTDVAAVDDPADDPADQPADDPADESASAGDTEPGAANSDTAGPGATAGAAPDAPVALDLSDQAVEQEIPPIVRGDVLARLEIPAIDRVDYVVPGVDLNDLKRGPGHYPDTPLPGQLGNASIAGHRTTYGAPFFDVDQLVTNDEIVVTMANGDRFVYLVTGVEVVAASDYWVVTTGDPDIAELTLTSCHPKYTARDRIVVRSVLDPTRSSNVGVPTFYELEPDPDDAPIPGDDPVLEADGEDAEPDAAGNAVIDDPTDAPAGDATDRSGDSSTESAADASPQPDSQPDPQSDTRTGDDAGDDTGDEAETDIGGAPNEDRDDADAGSELRSAPPGQVEDAFSQGWFHDMSAFPQIALWGAALTIISLAAYAVSRRFRHDSIGFLVGIGPFLFALYFFFQNVNRLLPPGL